MLVWCGCVESGVETPRFDGGEGESVMDARHVQRVSLGYALVATQSFAEGVSLARSFGAEGPVYI